MMSFDNHRARTLRVVISTLLGTAAFAASAPPLYAQTQPTLETVTVTAQRRETDLQTTPVAISAYGGEQLVENKIFTVNDLAAEVPAFSLTALTPLDAELNIRGITNTRLDSPTADPSVGTFVDGVYMGRTGDLNYDFYDLERIEVIRGPQGVLLGKNVVGGALSVITAKPTFENSGNVLASYGNYNSMLLSGFVNGGLNDSWASRLSFQGRKHDGYAEDVLHHRDVEDLESYQGRLQFLYGPDGSKFTGRLALDYNHDETNGLNTVAVAGGTKSCETTYLRTNCTRPWSNLRLYLGLNDPRKDVAQSIQYAGQPRIQQFMKRDGFGAVLDLQYEATGFTFNSLTGYKGRRRSAGVRPDRSRPGGARLGYGAVGAVHRVHQRHVRHARGDLQQRSVPVRAARRRRRGCAAVQPGVPAHVQRSGQPLRLDRRSSTSRATTSTRSTASSARTSSAA
jgi:iron complex outermembrane receptor protein